MKILIASLLFSLPAYALINGEEDVSHPAVVQVTFANNLACTGTVVGLKPVAVALAAHCLIGSQSLTPDRVTVAGVKANRLIFDPSLQFKYDQSKESAQAKSRDFAVALFPESLNETLQLTENDVFSVAPIDVSDGESMMMCGFGRTSKYWGNGSRSDYRKCGANLAFSKTRMRALRDRLPNPWRTDISDPLMDVDVIWFASPGILKTGVTRADEIIPWLNEMVAYPTRYAHGNKGDSGGPVFKAIGGVNMLLGVLSISFFDETDTAPSMPSSRPGSGPQAEVFFSGFTRIDSAAVRDIWEQVKATGAKIRGLSN